MTPQIIAEFDGKVLRPVNPCHSLEKGICYEIVEQRSDETHNHYFACIKTAWENLPTKYRWDYPTPEHLRKRALIESGYCSCTEICFTWIGDIPLLQGVAEILDEFAALIVKDSVVYIYRAKSQSYKAMKRDEFQKSKEDVLSFCAGLIGVTPEELSANGADI
jgi:hypothetical protein